MTAEHFRAGSYTRQNETEKEEKGNFCSPNRVTVREGTTPQSRSRLVEHPGLDQKPQGTIHRSSVDSFKPLPSDHKPFTSVHRPSGPFDLADLKSHQEAMLSPRSEEKAQER